MEALRTSIGNDYAYLESLYRHLHAHPELSYGEEKSAARMAAELGTLGFEVQAGIGGHGVVGVMRNGEGPTVLLRTDMDALPILEQTGLPYRSTITGIEPHTGMEVPVMHACGHDVHMTVFTGTARQLSWSKDLWSGTLIMLAQPAEEVGSGARIMMEDGLMDRIPQPDYALALHVDPCLEIGKVGIIPGYAFANVDSVDITVYGVGGHGAYPHTTKDPVVLASHIVLALQTIASREVNALDPVVVTVGSIHGGAKHNVISDRVDLQLTVRTYTEETQQQVFAAIRRIIEGCGRMFGLPENKLPQMMISDERTPAVQNNLELTTRIATTFRRVLGDVNVVESKPVMAGEDFGQYGRSGIPSSIFWLGCVAPDRVAAADRGEIKLPGLHSPYFAPLPEPTIRTGVLALSTAAIDLLK